MLNKLRDLNNIDETFGNKNVFLLFYFLHFLLSYFNLISEILEFQMVSHLDRKAEKIKIYCSEVCAMRTQIF